MSLQIQEQQRRRSRPEEEIQESPMPPVIRSTDNSVIPIVPVAQMLDVRISLPLQPPRSPGRAYHPVGLVEP